MFPIQYPLFDLSAYTAQDVYRAPAFDLGDFLGEYTPMGCFTTEIVRVARIVPTQHELIAPVLDRYARTGWDLGENRSLALGVRFHGAPLVYLLDGHHRWWAAQRRKRDQMLIKIDNVPFSIRSIL